MIKKQYRYSELVSAHCLGKSETHGMLAAVAVPSFKNNKAFISQVTEIGQDTLYCIASLL